MSRVKSRAGRAARLQAQKSVLTRLAPVMRKLQPLEVLNEAALERIHDASTAILEEVGIDFRDAKALSDWARPVQRLVATG